MTRLTDKQLNDLARLGAIARLQELEAEALAIRNRFPGLAKAVVPVAAPAGAAPKPHRKRKRRSLASRQAARARMKAYWAAKKRDQSPAPNAGGKAQAPVAGQATRAAEPRKATRPARKGKKAR